MRTNVVAISQAGVPTLVTLSLQASIILNVVIPVLHECQWTLIYLNGDIFQPFKNLLVGLSSTLCRVSFSVPHEQMGLCDFALEWGLVLGVWLTVGNRDMGGGDCGCKKSRELHRCRDTNDSNG